MPTINQLIRKGRREITKKANYGAKRMPTKTLVFAQGIYHNSQEAKLSLAQNSK